jgi:hypothetical protein
VSLRSLVEYAQANFAASPPVAGGVEPDDVARVQSSRPPIPSWLPDAGDTNAFPVDDSQLWLISGPIDPAPFPEIYGADALAYYLPFHFHRDRWGIYMLSSGSIWLGSILKGDRLIPGDEPYLELADQFLFEHELFHAYTEIACTRAEAIARSALYGRYFSDHEGGEHEEALANAYAVLRTQEAISTAAKSRLQAWMSRQGPGYKDYGSWAKWHALRRGRARAASIMLGPQPEPRPPSSSQEFLYRQTDRYEIPVVRVHDLSSSNVGILRPFPKELGLQILVHSNDHPPPHVHVRVVQDGFETRYTWPQLEPLPNDPELSRGDTKALRQYVSRHGIDISERVNAVYQRSREA